MRCLRPPGPLPGRFPLRRHTAQRHLVQKRLHAAPLHARIPDGRHQARPPALGGRPGDEHDGKRLHVCRPGDRTAHDRNARPRRNRTDRHQRHRRLLALVADRTGSLPTVLRRPAPPATRMAAHQKSPQCTRKPLRSKRHSDRQHPLALHRLGRCREGKRLAGALVVGAAKRRIARGTDGRQTVGGLLAEEIRRAQKRTARTRLRSRAAGMARQTRRGEQAEPPRELPRGNIGARHPVAIPGHPQHFGGYDRDSGRNPLHGRIRIHGPLPDACSRTDAEADERVLGRYDRPGSDKFLGRLRCE